MRTRVYVLNVLILIITICYGNDIVQNVHHDTNIKLSCPTMPAVPSSLRNERILYEFSINPETLLMSYYDYMIGGNNNLPLWVNPNTEVGGYYITFHGKRTTTGNRRVFATYIDNNGTIQTMSELANVNRFEGYPSMAIDPVTGKELYTWHAETDNTGTLDVLLSKGLFGFEVDDAEVIMNNPISMPAPYNTTDNEFVWPSVQIGSSPNPGMRRVYVLCRNRTGHSANITVPSSNVWIVYADFDEDMIENDTPLTWNHTTIPVLDEWNHSTTDVFRRPFCAFTVGDDDKVYFVGYHHTESILHGNIAEPELDAFVCDNYGAGTWTRITGSLLYHCWEPRSDYGNGSPFFGGYGENQFWDIANSEHLNAVYDSNGKIHMGVIFAHKFNDVSEFDTYSFFFGDQQIVKDIVYDVNTQSFSLREIYPIAGTSADTLTWLPWDNNADGVVDQYYTNPDNPNDPNNGDPIMITTWPFPHWDDSIHEDGMFFNYNNIKITTPNNHGMMAAVWQDCNRARLDRTGAFANTPEIWISCSSDRGESWSDPISLNNIETLQLAGMKPMWVYPANTVKYVSTTQDGLIGKLGLMFYDDYSWGAYVQDPPVGQNIGGDVKFAELQITFPLPAIVSDVDQNATPEQSLLAQNYPNPFNPETLISFQMVKAADCDLKIYNSKGQLVKTLFHGRMTKGEHKIVWNGTDNSGRKVSSGIYSYKIKSGTYAASGKMILLK